MTTHEVCPGGCNMLADECECPNPNPLAGFAIHAPVGSTTPTEGRRTGKVVQPPATRGVLADGRSPSDRLPVAPTNEKGSGRRDVAAAGPRRST